MAELIWILIPLVLAGGFLALTQWERARGTRVLAGMRMQLDTEVERALFVFDHVDWNSYAREEVKAALLWIGHALAHITLQLVRSVERLLTHTVRTLRTHVERREEAPRPTERPFVQALSGFKEELKATRPEIPQL